MHIYLIKSSLSWNSISSMGSLELCLQVAWWCSLPAVVKKISLAYFTPLCIPASFVKDKVTIGTWVSLRAFHLVPWIYISVFIYSCSVAKSYLTVCDTIDSSARLLCPWDFLGKNTGVGCRFLLQGIFPTQGWNHGSSAWQVDFLLLCYQGNPSIHYHV